MLADIALVASIAALARLPGLGRLPNPAGDEGNWAWIALRLSRGEPAQLDQNASFVSLLPARAIAASLRAFGVGYASARLVPAIAMIVACVVTYLALASDGGPRARALSVSLLVALHPWCVLWSRTAAVPYALALACCVSAATLLVTATNARKVARVVVAVQLLGLSLQFSPLAAAFALACAALCVTRERRWVFRHPATWVSVVVAAVFAANIVRGAAHVARAMPARVQFDHIGTRVLNFAHSIVTGVAGEATVRHFSSAAVPWPLTLAFVLPVAALVVFAIREARETRRVSPGLVLSGVALLAMPFILARGRDWQLARIDTDRYVFILLPGISLVAGELAASSNRLRQWSAWMFVVLVALGSARAIGSLALGGGPDRGVRTAANGGGYRGWRVIAGRTSVPESLRDAMLGVSPRGGMLHYADWSFHTVHLLFEGMGGLRAWPTGLGPAPAPSAATHYFVMWAPGVFADGFEPASSVRDNDELRAWMHARFHSPRIVQTLALPNGRPWIELWRADE